LTPAGGSLNSCLRSCANTYDNASCESFMKTLKREEIQANRYNNLEQLRANIEEFIEEYCNRQRLHSALGY
jgi:putative transposase